MNIEIKDIVTLDNNNKYVVASKILHDKHAFYFLTNVNNMDNYLFCYQKDSSLIEINDPKMIEKLAPIFLKNLVNNIF